MSEKFKESKNIRESSSEGPENREVEKMKFFYIMVGDEGEDLGNGQINSNPSNVREVAQGLLEDLRNESSESNAHFVLWAGTPSRSNG